MASPVTIGHIGLAGDSTGVFSNETGAGGSIHMAGEVIFLGDGWAGELIPLQLLLVNTTELIHIYHGLKTSKRSSSHIGIQYTWHFSSHVF